MTAALDTRIQENSALAAGGPTSAPPGWRWSSAGLRVGANDPSPLSDAASFWRLMSQVATIAMATIMIGVCLYFAQPLVVPILGALVVSLTIGPLAGYATKHGLPAFVPALAIVAIIALMVYVTILLLADPASELIARAPEIGEKIKAKFIFMERPLAAIRDLRAALMGAETGEGGCERADRSDR